MLQKIYFENPDKKSLGELFFYIKEDGVQLKVSALNERWVHKRCYTKYKSLVGDGGQILTGVELEDWLNNAEWFRRDLKYLLELAHFRFWSHLVFESKCMEVIISFLQEATPSYLDLTPLIQQPRVKELYTEILQYVFRIICRMITNKESDREWISREHLGELLYYKFLISIPMIFDLIIVYGRSNLNVLSRIVQTILKIEPKYKDDLKISIEYIQKTLKIIQKKTENEGMVNNDDEAVSSFDDLALYTLDCACTLSILLEIYPPARNLCNEIQLEQSITNFYDNTISPLYKNIFIINSSSKYLDYLNRARMEFVQAFRCLTYLHIENILRSPNESLIYAESYIAILTECLADRTFVVDYQKYFPVKNDIEILNEACRDLDQFKTDFVLKAYTSEGESYLVDMVESNGNNGIDENGGSYEMVTELENGISELAVELPEKDIEKEVSKVLDILPYLGDGFVRKLLERYDSTEQAISAVLEGNLPPDLDEADQHEIYIPSDPQEKVFMETGIRRNNIFDGDKYDVLTQDNPECVIKIGKGFPGQARNVEQLLNDKSYVKAMKEKYQEYSVISDNEYEDEYDDSYEALAESEAKTSRSKTIKNVLVDEIEDEESEESEESDDNIVEDSSSGRDKTKEYIQNPEILRAQYEAKRNAKASVQSSTHNKNVVGKPKGHGQEKDVLINRHKKEVKKSSRANHNRKSGAAWKRSRGMMPF